MITIVLEKRSLPGRSISSIIVRTEILPILIPGCSTEDNSGLMILQLFESLNPITAISWGTLILCLINDFNAPIAALSAIAKRASGLFFHPNQKIPHMNPFFKWNIFCAQNYFGVKGDIIFVECFFIPIKSLFRIVWILGFFNNGNSSFSCID